MAYFVFKFIFQNQAKVRLLDIVQLDALQVRDFVKVILEFYKLHNLPLDSLEMLTSDGASMMTGRSGKVVALKLVMRLFHFWTLFNQKKGI